MLSTFRLRLAVFEYSLGESVWMPPTRLLYTASTTPHSWCCIKFKVVDVGALVDW